MMMPAILPEAVGAVAVCCVPVVDVGLSLAITGPVVAEFVAYRRPLRLQVDCTQCNGRNGK